MFKTMCITMRPPEKSNQNLKLSKFLQINEIQN